MNRLRSTGPTVTLGIGAGLVLTAITVVALLPVRTHVSRATPALVLVISVVAAGVLGGVGAALLTAVVAALALNVVFIPPFGTPTIDKAEDWVALAVFVAVALAVGLLVAAEAERRRAAEQREASLRDLNDEMQAMAADRERLAEDATRAQVLERVDEQRSALMRSVSHDLRTPLAAIRAIATDLRDGADYDDATRAELLQTVSDETERLDRLVANLLSLSRIEAGALRPDRQAVDVHELVTTAIRRLDGLFRQVRVQVEVPPDLPLVDADYTQLDQVVTNLLENASRYAPPASTVRVTAAARRDRVEISVSDEGIGVPDWERERIFEPFRQGEGRGASGIGLAICKAVAEAHGGRVAVDRTPGGGATFAVDLPARDMSDRA